MAHMSFIETKLELVECFNENYFAASPLKIYTKLKDAKKYD